MARWRVDGADLDTGEDRQVVVDADSEAMARVMGHNRGVAVSRVVCLDAPFSPGDNGDEQAPPARPAAAPPPPPPPPVRLPRASRGFLVAVASQALGTTVALGAVLLVLAIIRVGLPDREEARPQPPTPPAQGSFGVWRGGEYVLDGARFLGVAFEELTETPDGYLFGWSASMLNLSGRSIELVGFVRFKDSAGSPIGSDREARLVFRRVEEFDTQEGFFHATPAQAKSMASAEWVLTEAPMTR